MSIKYMATMVLRTTEKKQVNSKLDNLENMLTIYH